MAKIIRTDKLDPDRPLSVNDREWIYNGLDCCVTLEVLQNTLPLLDHITSKTYKFSLAMQAPVLEMSLRGMRVDLVRRQEVLEDTKAKIAIISNHLGRLVRDGIGVEWWNSSAIKPSWASATQTGKLVYDVMGFKEIKKRRQNGAYTRSADRDALEKLEQFFFAEPICRHIIALRELDKVRQRLETPIDTDGRERCNYNIAGTTTGRLASAISDFGTGNNMQNVDRNLRSQYVADPGMKMGNFDLEQADARNVGAICWNLFAEEYGEPFAGGYLDACESSDLHTVVCRMGWPDLAWTGDPKRDRGLADTVAYRTFSFRDLSKKLGHGSNYVGQPYTMAQHTKTTSDAVRVFQRNYFAAFPCIGEFGAKLTEIGDKPNWHNSVKQALRTDGQITSLLGRRRYFFGRPTDAATVREAVAHEPQSLTAEQINIGILRLWRSRKVELLGQVHDNVLLQFPEGQEDELVPWIIETLRVRIPLKKGREFIVPVEAKTGWNWGDEHPTENPTGLRKYKGSDNRVREPIRKMKKLSLWDY